jgi:tetratricopeptide (TPR) repeat protein
MAEFHSLHGDALHGANRNQEAFNAYENSLRYNPDNSGVLNNYAYYLALENRDLDKAVEMAEKANALSPDNPTFLDTYAWTLYKRGQYPEALMQMEKAIKLQEKPGAVEMEHFGDILYQLGRIDEAKKWWNQANEIGGGSDLLQKKVTDGKLYE